MKGYVESFGGCHRNQGLRIIAEIIYCHPELFFISSRYLLQEVPKIFKCHTSIRVLLEERLLTQGLRLGGGLRVKHLIDPLEDWVAEAPDGVLRGQQRFEQVVREGQGWLRELSRVTMQDRGWGKL